MFENWSLRLTDSDEVFKALSSETSRRILQWLTESPGEISEIAADLDLSVQNVNYQVDRFEWLKVVERLRIRHPPKAQEMTIYASS